VPYFFDATWNGTRTKECTHGFGAIQERRTVKVNMAEQIDRLSFDNVGDDIHAVAEEIDEIGRRGNVVFVELKAEEEFAFNHERSPLGRLTTSNSAARVASPLQ
jgi:hypothetical protein